MYQNKLVDTEIKCRLKQFIFTKAACSKLREMMITAQQPSILPLKLRGLIDHDYLGASFPKLDPLKVDGEEEKLKGE